jgi:hypothetical protein
LTFVGGENAVALVSNEETLKGLLVASANPSIAAVALAYPSSSSTAGAAQSSPSPQMGQPELTAAEVTKIVRDELDRGNKTLEFVQGQIDKDRTGCAFDAFHTAEILEWDKSGRLVC